MSKMKEILEGVFKTELEGLTDFVKNISYHDLERAVDVLSGSKGRILVTGMGKSGNIGAKIAATFTSTGTPSVFVHAAESLHGDLGQYLKGDTVLVLSKSGETRELLDFLPLLKENNIPLISITEKRASPLGKISDVVIETGSIKEAWPLGAAPTTSTTLTLLIGDALAVALMHKKGFTEKDFASIHPQGSLGLKLKRAGEVMNRDLPLVGEEETLQDVARVLNEKNYGIALVVSISEKLSGVISDGDFKRIIVKHGAEALKMPARMLKSESPRVISEDTTLYEALKIMETAKITVLVVIDGLWRPLGLLHIHHHILKISPLLSPDQEGVAPRS